MRAMIAQLVDYVRVNKVICGSKLKLLPLMDYGQLAHKRLKMGSHVTFYG